MAASGNHDVLFPIRAEAVCHRSGMSAIWKLHLPEFLPGLNIKGADEGIESAGDENQSARGDNRPPQADRSWRHRDLLAAKVLHRTKRDLPPKLPIGHIYRSQHAPRWGCTRQVRWRLEESAKQSIGCPSLRG